MTGVDRLMFSQVGSIVRYRVSFYVLRINYVCESDDVKGFFDRKAKILTWIVMENHVWHTAEVCHTWRNYHVPIYHLTKKYVANWVAPTGQ